MTKRNKEFSDILDECLARLLVKGETLEQCLANHPEQAVELRPLLETAMAAKQASAIEPGPGFKARARYQFHSALQEMGSKKRLSFFGWLPRWATVVAIVLVLLLAGSGTVAAASNSMPDEPLYPIKIASEQARLMLTLSALGKAEMYATLADKRIDEIVYVANKGDTKQVELTTQRLNYALIRIATLVSVQGGGSEIMKAPPPAPAFAPDESAGTDKNVNTKSNGRSKLRQTLARYAINHQARLLAVLEEAPESIKPALRQAIAISVDGYEKALEAAED